MTQELIANMLGVRREGVTEAAASCRRQGSSSTGAATSAVLDRARLEAACLRVLRGGQEGIRPPAAGWPSEAAPVRAVSSPARVRWGTVLGPAASECNLALKPWMTAAQNHLLERLPRRDRAHLLAGVRAGGAGVERGAVRAGRAHPRRLLPDRRLHLAGGAGRPAPRLEVAWSAARAWTACRWCWA